MKINLRIDMSEWNRTFPQYMRHTKKDLATVLNEKAYRIAWGAYNRTYQAERSKIESQLMYRVEARREDGTFGFAPIAGIRAQKLQKKKTGAGWKTVPQLRRATRAVINRHIRATAFMRSGWLEALKAFSIAVGNPMRRKDKFSASKTRRGGGTIAVPGWAPVASLFNSALAKSTKNTAALQKYAGKALQEAVSAEVVSMRGYIERKLQRTANRYTRR